MVQTRIRLVRGRLRDLKLRRFILVLLTLHGFLYGRMQVFVSVCLYDNGGGTGMNVNVGGSVRFEC